MRWITERVPGAGIRCGYKAVGGTAADTKGTIMTTHASHPHSDVQPLTFSRELVAGVVGGLAGGLVFGVMMAMMGVLPTIASMVGSTSAGVGFTIHLLISVIIGLGLTLVLPKVLGRTFGRGIVVGLAYGALWWVLGPLLIMPMMMGMPVFMIGVGSMMSLLGHLVYGVILAVVAVAFFRRSA